MSRLFGRLLTLAGLVAVGAGVAALYGYGRNQVVEGIYRDKLAEVVKSHEALRAKYEAAVAQTIITELEVRDGEVDVIIRNAEGVLERIETPLDPTGEVHVDYLVVDGRLYIRRVYDDATPPRNAKMIDPKLANVDWTNKDVQRGLTVYRGGLTDGRWVISTTGNGALDLVKAEGPTPPMVAGPVSIESFDAVAEQIDTKIATVQASDVLDRLQRKYLRGEDQPAE